MTNRKLAEIVRRQNPVTLPSNATVQEACRLMHKHHIGAMLVTEDGGSLVGVFTGRDAVGRVVAEARDPTTTTLRYKSCDMSPCPAPFFKTSSWLAM